MKINTEGIFIAPWHLATYEKGGKEQGGCQRAVDLFSYVKILGKPIKKQVKINHCKYVCMKLLLGKLTICIDTQSRSPCTNAQCLHYNWHQYIVNTEGVFIAPWHPAHKEQGEKEQGAREH